MYPQQLGNEGQVRTSSLLNDDVIPSVKGEWYNYRSVFTPARPLGYLMKCKSNKDRTLSFVEQNSDVDLTFVFGLEGVKICSPDSKLSIELMFDVVINIDVLKRTMIARAPITIEQFNLIRDSKDRDGLVSACCLSEAVEQLLVTEGMIITVMTPTRKYCLMRVVEVGPDAVRFDACHILL